MEEKKINKINPVPELIFKKRLSVFFHFISLFLK